ESINRTLDVAQDLFVSAVAADRHMDRDRLLTLLDGRLWPPTELQRAGLVDSVGYRDDAGRIAGPLAGPGARPRVARPASPPADPRLGPRRAARGPSPRRWRWCTRAAGSRPGATGTTSCSAPRSGRSR